MARLEIIKYYRNYATQTEISLLQGFEYPYGYQVEVKKNGKVLKYSESFLTLDLAKEDFEKWIKLEG